MHIDTELETWLPGLLQTNDAIFPSGSYAHSFGLEGLVELKLVTEFWTVKIFSAANNRARAGTF